MPALEMTDQILLIVSQKCQMGQERFTGRITTRWRQRVIVIGSDKLATTIYGCNVHTGIVVFE